jgi:hypothetical protein
MLPSWIGGQAATPARRPGSAGRIGGHARRPGRDTSSAASSAATIGGQAVTPARRPVRRPGSAATIGGHDRRPRSAARSRHRIGGHGAELDRWPDCACSVPWPTNGPIMVCQLVTKRSDQRKRACSRQCHETLLGTVTKPGHLGNRYRN